MRKIISIIVAALALSACSTMKAANTAVDAAQVAANTAVSQETIDKARAAVLGIHTLYGAAVIVADDWAKQPPCGRLGSPAPPLCSTDKGIVAINKAALAMQAVLAQSESVVFSKTPSQNALDLAIQSAQNSWAAYKQVAAIYGIKTGG